MLALPFLQALPAQQWSRCSGAFWAVREAAAPFLRELAPALVSGGSPAAQWLLPQPPQLVLGTCRRGGWPSWELPAQPRSEARSGEGSPVRLVLGTSLGGQA